MTLDSSIKNRFHSSNYQLIEMIGQGGFGMVFKARQISTDQTVAIKFLTLSSEFDSEKKQRYLERFQRETALSSRLQHPNIVRLLDKGVCDEDLVYAVFEYVDGKSLKELLSEKGALLPADTANLMGQVLDALSHAHEQGVIHRDLKPANIMLSKVGTKEHIKILDFGIGTLSNEVRQHDYKSITLTNETLGTPSYSAPEQLRGESPSIKSDIYVWGLVFIECLTGEPAITGNSLASIFHKQLSLSNVPIPTAVAGHPVANLLRRVLNKKVNERAGDAGLIYNDLKQININSLVGDLSLKQNSNDNEYVNEFNQYGDKNKEFAISNSICTDDFNKESVALALQETQINTAIEISSSIIEQKQISVLCVTLTLSGILHFDSSESDLELLDVIHRDSRSQAIDIAIRYGAYHAGTLGDTLLFYFGYPSVSDNDSRLCARAALDITSNINQRNSLLKQSEKLEIVARMGMHTGIVSHYSDAMPEGAAINIAMELSRLARPKQVLCSQTSRRLLEGYIEFKMALNTSLGVNSSQAVHQLIGERLNEAFGFLRSTRTANAFVGRDEELEELKSFFNGLHSSKASYVHIYGEAGIGKSRLIYEVRGLANSFQHYLSQCLPENQHNGLYPILTIIKNKYNIQDVSSEYHDKNFLEAVKVALKESDEIDSDISIPILLTWLNMPIPEEMSIAPLAAEVQKDILFKVLTFLLLKPSEGSNEKILFFIEDVHWSDPISIEFFSIFYKNKMFDRKKHFVIFTSRTRASEKISMSDCCLIELVGLNADKSKLFINEFFNRDSISARVYEAIIRRTDGIPFYMEELISMMLNKNIVHHFNGVVDFVSDRAISYIPDTLLDSLQTKIDSLLYSKDTAQVAAVIGREFDYKLLLNVSNKNSFELQRDLNELVAKDLLYKQRIIEGDVYIFKHALVRDAVYGGLNATNKKSIHNAIANSIEKDKSNDDVNNLLSFHYSSAENYEKSAVYANASAVACMQRSQYEQAIHYSKVAYDSACHYDSTYEFKVEINQILTTATMMTLGWGGEEVEKLVSRSQKLIENLSEKSNDLKARTYLSLATYNNVRGNHNKVYGIIRLALSINELDTGLKSALYALKAHCLWCQGKFDKALSYTERARSLYDDKLHYDHAEKFGHDTKVFALSLEALIYASSSMHEIAEKTIQNSIKYAEEINSVHSLCMSKFYWCCCLYLNKNFDKLKSTSEEILSICELNNLANWDGVTNIMFSLISGDADKAEDSLRDLLKAGASQMQGFWNSIIAEVEIENGNEIKAISRLEASIQQSREVEDYFFVELQQKIMCKLNHNKWNRRN
ncbi:protein kinase domain-containing protein [Marinomonas sp. SBI8L]|uniref:protein kinase domain-containing protein n=2 Tax=unclassified Marinomonas TaxID=196814 RepID=UPI0007AF146C|nr:protein kinase [Marinomonas sp. SBI8L]